MEEQSHASPRPRGIKNEFRRALGAFSPLERLAFLAAVTLGAFAVFSLLYRINDHFLVSIPANGGTLHEGVIGTPRFVNPLLATTDADHDLSALVYRGLMKKDTSGTLVPDLAESYSVSNDGLTYTFVLKDVQFQDGQKLTADDVVFTVQSAQDPMLKSALRVAWQGVLAKAIDAKTVTFTLKQPYAPFLASTTVGILPKHIWGTITYDNWAYSDYNTKNAVGEGLYKISGISQSSTGVPAYYSLSATRLENAPKTRIDGIEMHFYSSQDDLLTAYKSGAIDSLGGIDPASADMLAEGGAQVVSSPLPRVFGLFFNQSQAKIFADPVVRKAIDMAINKDRVVSQVLGGYGEVANGPIPASSGLTDASAPEIGTNGGNIAAAKKMLEKDGWTLGTDGIYTKVISKKETDRLSFEIATNNTPELAQSATLISNDLLAAGIQATPKVYETGSLNQDIIRPRKFQALFFGEVVSAPSDLYAFWHSSQRNDPGLNISGYTNSKVDTELQQGLATLDAKQEATIYTNFTATIMADMPASFVYSPSYIYVIRQGLTGITLGHITKPEDRFAGITNWYLTTDRVWKIFVPKQ